MSNSEIAQRVGMDATSVSVKRQKLGIAPWGRTGRKPRVWTKAELKLLGKFPDAEVARRMGLHRRRVAIKRIQLGIPNLVTTKKQNSSR